MTKEQIQMLRELIQAEIFHAIQDYKNPEFCSYETARMNDKYWEQFTETFNSTTGPFEIYV